MSRLGLNRLSINSIAAIAQLDGLSLFWERFTIPAKVYQIGKKNQGWVIE